MYCVNCGVKLGDGAERCPLCQTPVWNPLGNAAEHTYPPDREPIITRESRLPLACLLSAVSLLAVIVTLSVCLSLYHGVSWGGYVLSGVAAGYVIFVLPLWFRRFSPLIAIPLDHAAALLFVSYVCAVTRGHWLWSFALPVIALSCALTLGIYCLWRFVRRGRPYIVGGFIMALGAYTVLIELFEHIAFGHAMFRWSQYSAGSCLAVGFFFLLVGMIRPLREALDRRFFL